MLVIVALSLVDGLLANVVAYERDTTVFYFPLMELGRPATAPGRAAAVDAAGVRRLPHLCRRRDRAGLPARAARAAAYCRRIEHSSFLRLLHLSIAALGTFALARTWRLPYASAALAGVVFALGNFLQAQIHHENIVRTASWLPVMLALVERGLRAETWRSAAALDGARRRWRWAWPG